MSNKISNTKEQKSKIGFAHGSISIMGGIVLAYLFLMVFTKYMPGDYGVRIVPSIVLTPIFISIFGLWLLFSKSIFQAIFKFVLPCIFLLLILKAF